MIGEFEDLDEINVYPDYSTNPGRRNRVSKHTMKKYAKAQNKTKSRRSILRRISPNEPYNPNDKKPTNG